MSKPPYMALTPHNQDMEPTEVGLIDWIFIEVLMNVASREDGSFEKFHRFSQGLEDADATLTSSWHRVLSGLADELLVVDYISSLSVEVVLMKSYDMVSRFKSGAHISTLQHSAWAEEFYSLLKLLENCQGLTATPL